MDEHTRVCIVGKSSSLSGKKLGSVIDSHDLITRINFKNSDHDESLHWQDVGKKTHHIVVHPKVLMHSIKHSLCDVIKNLESLEDSDHGKKIFVPTYSKEYWDVDGDYPYKRHRFPTEQTNPNTKKEKDQCLRELWAICWDLGVTVEKQYYSEISKHIYVIANYFYEGKLSYPHGLLTGTRTAIDYTEKYKKISVAGMGNESTYSHDLIHATEDKNRYYGKTKPMDKNIRLEYDYFFLKQAINSRRIKRLDDESDNTI